MQCVSSGAQRHEPLSAVGIPYRRSPACVRAEAVLCQVSVARQQAFRAVGGIVGHPAAALLVRGYPHGRRAQERGCLERRGGLVPHRHTADGHRLYLGHLLADGAGLRHRSPRGRTGHRHL